jgi:hypothetical protein
MVNADILDLAPLNFSRCSGSNGSNERSKNFGDVWNHGIGHQKLAYTEIAENTQQY